MARKRTPRRVIIPMPPRGLRPRLAVDQQRDLAICHIENLDAMVHGDASEGTLWQVVGAALTWSRVAQLLGVGEPEMLLQMSMVTAVVERYGRTGKVAFTGPEYQLAKDGTLVMDELARIVDRPTAVVAAEWSERRVNQIEAEHRDRALQREEMPA
jgi:hypothetical protein